tara:strand:- start:4230 stop:5537 length:1308 start_codon:yes stop_codon:yes gene_type:complete
MLSFKQLQEKKTKIKINPKKDEVIESSEVKKNHGEDCDCSKCDKKRRKEDVNDGPDVANEGYDKPDEKLKTDRNMFSIPKGEQDAAAERLKAKAAAKRKAKLKEESAYVSQEEVSEESTEESAETEIPFLTFNQYQHARTLDEEQLNEFLDKLFGGGKKPANAGGAAQPSPSQQMPSHVGLAGKLGARRQMMNQMMGKPDQKVLGYSKGGPVKKEEVEISEAPTVSPRGQDGKASGPTGLVQKSINSIGLGSAFRSGPESLLGKSSVPSVSAAPPSKINTSPSTSLAKPNLSSNMMSKPVARKTPKKPMIMKKPLPRRPMMNSVSLKTFGSFLKERTRYAKETGKDFKTGNPSEKGGEGRSEVGKSMQKMMRPTGGAMSSRGKAIQPQGKKKDKGAKPKFKSEPTPVDKIKRKLSDKRAPKKDPYGYGQGRYQGD